MRLFMPALALAMASLAVPLRATTTVAPTFAELVSAAVTIVESEVLETRARYVSGRERTIIVTDVIVRVAQTFKGREQSSMVLTFHGGTVGDVTYRIDGMPTFAVGDRDVLFIQGEEGISPLVGMMHGRVRAVTDPTTREVSMRRFDGRPL